MKTALSDDSRLLEFVARLKSRVNEITFDAARANIDNLYKHGRLQGSLDGLQEALQILDKVLLEDSEEEFDS